MGPPPADLPNVAEPSASTELEREVSRRRTFAIISHPDAGKTTLTEKLLLYAGAIELAGAVRGRKARRHATSDWMELEQERGISITSAALEFELQGRRMSLLDTPGHKDFSEDTYRALIAADSVVMVIDAANGVEDQTRKLFEVCRRHRLPILTFVNKFDRPSRDPLELLDDLERTLGIAAAPVNWPIGSAERFRGVYDIQRPDAASLRARGAGAVSGAGRHVVARRSGRAGDDRRRRVRAFPRVAGRDPRRRHARSTWRNIARDGRRRCSSAARLTNFGLEPFLQALVELAPPPQPRPSDSGIVSPTDERFTGFVFKIQANMDPRHRDRVAFVRVCSGRFTKDMVRVQQPRREARSGRRAPTGSSAAIARRSTSPTRATSSASSTRDSSRSATRSIPARRCGFSICRAFRRSTSAASACRTPATSSSTRG